MRTYNYNYKIGTIINCHHFFDVVAIDLSLEYNQDAIFASNYDQALAGAKPNMKFVALQQHLHECQ